MRLYESLSWQYCTLITLSRWKDATISYGHAKINYNTEINIAWSNALRKVLNADESVYAPMQIQDPAKEAMSEVIEEIFKRTDAYNQAEWQ